jgi:hypothetical protein
MSKPQQNPSIGDIDGITKGDNDKRGKGIKNSTNHKTPNKIYINNTNAECVIEYQPIPRLICNLNYKLKSPNSINL